MPGAQFQAIHPEWERGFYRAAVPNIPLLKTAQLWLLCWSPKCMNRLLAVLGVVLGLCGCATAESARPSAKLDILPTAQVAGTSTADLTARRAQIFELIVQIQHEVELKAGLPMGVSIYDERSKLAELYLEARQIDRELLRRFQIGDGTARAETIKASF